MIPKEAEIGDGGMEISQYYLSTLDEEYELRLRKINIGDTNEHTATVKSGTGAKRLEIETMVSAETYATWHEHKKSEELTKLRQVIITIGGEWAVDSYLDGSGVKILEAEGEAVVQPADWREVTDEAEYKNSRLAKTLAQPEAKLRFDPQELAARTIELQRKFKRPIIIAVAGGPGSGKTTLARQIQTEIGVAATVMHQDDYYRGATRLIRMHGSDYIPNWDLPIAYDMPKLASDLSRLQSGEDIRTWQYDMSCPEPSTHPVDIDPTKTPIIILEGIHAIHDSLRGWLDMELYLDVPMATRIGRRLVRDVARVADLRPTRICAT